jgi:Zn ribbon nucleic-acid-binding protein
MRATPHPRTPKETKQIQPKMLTPQSRNIGRFCYEILPIDIRPPPALSGSSTGSRDGNKAAAVTPSPFQRSLWESVGKSKNKKRLILSQEKQKTNFNRPLDENVPKRKITKISGKLRSQEGIGLQWSRNVKYILKEKYQELIGRYFFLRKLRTVYIYKQKDSADEVCIHCSLPYRLHKWRDNLIRCTWCLKCVYLLRAAIEGIDKSPMCATIALNKQSNFYCGLKLCSLHKDTNLC